MKLTSDDLKALAADIGLDVVIGSDELEAHTTSIHGALHDYVLWSRGDEAGSPASQVEAWAQSMSRWVEEGIVLRQVRRGFRLRDRLLRPANVVVAKAVSAAPVTEARAGTEQS